MRFKIHILKNKCSRKRKKLVMGKMLAVSIDILLLSETRPKVMSSDNIFSLLNELFIEVCLCGYFL